MLSKLLGALFFFAGAGSVVYGASFVNSPESMAVGDCRIAGTMLVAGGVLAAIGVAFVVFPRERRR